ncbi:MAG: class I poly(R)-hydroxyalkanoic acid synthase [Rickettsiales bacterium]|nr:class I poly(R)-hydroxyalkanoic acid synthase [Rickettsiales bacterium]
MTPKKDAPPPQPFDTTRFARNMNQLAQEWQALMGDMARHNGSNSQRDGEREIMQVSRAFSEMGAKLVHDPSILIDMQYEYCQRWLGVWGDSMQRFLGEPPAPPPARRDRRFDDPAWTESVYFDFLKQSYLMTAGWLHEMVRRTDDDMDVHTAKKVNFYTRQFTDAMSPSNFLFTNPEALKATLESHGENLIRGMRHMREDFLQGNGKLNIRMTDAKAFEFGKNIATTPGKVMFENDLMQLLQFAPSTPTVHKTPLLLIPAWINKYYIFDLQPQNSFVKWLVDKGYTVFVVSWVNPDASLAEKTFEDYLLEGPLAALDAIERITGEKQTACVGYCLGGSLLSIALAWLHAKGQADRVVSATYLTTMIDFSEPGELGVFIDEEQITALEERMNAKGYLEGREMSVTFNMLRANDLIWSFVVNNYLLGKEPFPFDLLFWNSDSTRMPAKMHSFYLRNMYNENRLMKPGGLKIGGVSIDLSKIKTPSYLLSTREDHIAPWHSTFAATKIYSGPVTFTLAASGHIAGVINAPAKNKYSYWTNTLAKADTPRTWLDKAKETAGSWWPHWDQWQRKTAGRDIAARQPGEGPVAAIEDAPGRYVKVR